MCGRYSLTTERHDLARELGIPLDAIPEELVPRFNIAPTQPVPVLREEPDGIRMDLFQWGLVPEWADDTRSGARLINARSETLAEKPSFRDAFREKRCLVPADGFFEWATAPAGPKTPYYIRLKGGGVFTFAGLWSRWRDDGGRELYTCTIITGEPNDLVAPVHDRMPVIVPPGNRDAWLAHDHHDTDSLRPLLSTFAADAMEKYEVTRHVNSVAHDDAACVEAVTGTHGDTPPGGSYSLFD